jgi:hypothetical protein
MLGFGPLTCVETRPLARQRQEHRRIGPPLRKHRFFVLPIAPASCAA